MENIQLLNLIAPLVSIATRGRLQLVYISGAHWEQLTLRVTGQSERRAGSDDKYWPLDFSAGLYHSIEQLNTFITQHELQDWGWINDETLGIFNTGDGMGRKILFHQVCERSKCLLCCISVVKRKFNVERHYKNKHASTYDSIVGDDRRKMMRTLREPYQTT